MAYTAQCGHKASKAGLKYCRECWRARGPEIPAEQRQHLASICGHPTYNSGKKYCGECYRRRGQTRPDPNIVTPALDYESAWATWQKQIGMARDRYAGPKAGRKLPKSGTQKILVIPDLHAPFHEAEMFADMLAREGDVDKAICIGDLSDSYSLSTFTHYRSVSFAEEWASVTLCLQAMSERFPQVEIVIGNHDARLEKRLRERLDEHMVDAVKFLSGGILCPITALARRYPNVGIARHYVPGGDSIDWFTTCGDAWFGHPEKYGRTPGTALRFVEDWLSDHEYDLGLERYRLICLGHTHQMGMFPWRGRQLLVEVGCLAQQQGYMLKPKIGGRPQMRGYVTFTQTNGVTDLNSVKLHNFDFAAQQERVA